MYNLLDKGVVRRMCEGLRNSESGRALTPEQRHATELIRYASETEILFVSLKTFHLLGHFAPDSITRQIRSVTHLLQPAKYQRRWSRRLQALNFSHEDAYELSLCSFGTDLTGLIFSVDVFVTLDIRLIEKFNRNLLTIEHRFGNLTRHIRSPYCYATLPVVVTPEDVITV